MSPYKGRRLVLDLDTGHRLVISVRGVTGCFVVDVEACTAENALELFDGTGARIAGGHVRSWAMALSDRGAANS